MTSKQVEFQNDLKFLSLAVLSGLSGSGYNQGLLCIQISSALESTDSTPFSKLSYPFVLKGYSINSINKQHSLIGLCEDGLTYQDHLCSCGTS